MRETWQVLDRRTGERVAEPIYGERWLRWAYEKRLGQLATVTLAARPLFSTLYGWKMKRRASAKLIAPFIAAYGIDMKEAVELAEPYRSFNEFFIRRLKPSARPLPEDPAAVAFPADGRHFLLRDLAAQPRFWAKHEVFSVETLLGPFAFGAGRAVLEGDAVISRLAPIDYHRFHFPWAGKILAMATLGGPLYSVHPFAVRRTLRYLVSNKRTITVLEDPVLGRWAMVEIGATNVGTIRQTHPVGTPAARGAEKGYFAFGGSCVITLWPRGAVEFAPDLVAASGEGIELLARCGEAMGRLRSPVIVSVPDAADPVDSP
jgi:phosphatidylserine decarboxylase